MLAKQPSSRKPELINKFPNVPYLNSSLFEITSLEDKLLRIEGLHSSLEIQISSFTILKNNQSQKLTGSRQSLTYLLDFLDSYKFGSSNETGISEDNRTIINASVLGLIFEKINGYKDGSFFTPSFVTMYMAKQAIEKAIITKFNSQKDWNCQDLKEVHNRIGNSQADKMEANQIINSLKIVDPAVGSGHFLVSALNEMIFIKHFLGILQDENGKILRDYNIELENDEIIITDENEQIYQYNYHNLESSRVQKTFFHEKQIIIENCLFGVDINPNSVKIYQLRLWIELLKNTYYKADGQLQTLPNIDINVKTGNSLISRFETTQDLEKMLKNTDFTVQSYRQLFEDYHNAKIKGERKLIEEKITSIKSSFQTYLSENSKVNSDIKKLQNEIAGKYKKIDNELFETTKEIKKDIEDKIKTLNSDLKDKELEKQDILTGKIYNNAFEWRFEFPQVLTTNDDFVGFDLVIGNPPYIGINKFDLSEKKHFENNYVGTFAGTGDIYGLFYELGWNLIQKQGLLGFIISNKWLRAGYGKPIRNFLSTKSNPLILLDLGPKIFDHATVDTNIILLAKDTNQGQTKALKVDRTFFEKTEKKSSQEFNLINFDNSEDWFIGNSEEINLKQKIESVGKPLKDWDVKINYGIKTGLNEAFIIDEEKKNELITKDPKSAEIIKPILRGRDIKRYGFKFANLYIITTFPVLKLNIDNYPAVRDYLLGFGKERLEQSGKILPNGIKSRKKTGNKWFETQDQIAYFREFGKEKIIYPETTLENNFSYCKNGYLIDKTGFILVGKNLKFLLGVLCSDLFKKTFRSLFAGITLGEKGFQLNKNYLENFPIPILDTPEKCEIAGQIEVLVGKIMSMKTEVEKSSLERSCEPSERGVSELKHLPPTKLTPSSQEGQNTTSLEIQEGQNTTSLETQIDKSVYQLYDLQ